jgi:catechol 2,3-dioxygenase-like lactoylglutathione lyase family enzyme
MIKAIFHLNINCSNFERSVEFYKTLGFRVVMDIPEGGSDQMSKGPASRTPLAAQRS